MAVGKSERPSWLNEDCPPWCAREHHEGDHPEDRLHSSEPVHVPVVLRESLLVQTARATELLVQQLCALGDGDTWVLVCEPEDARHGMLLSSNSARALRAALASADLD